MENQEPFLLPVFSNPSEIFIHIAGPIIVGVSTFSNNEFVGHVRFIEDCSHHMGLLQHEGVLFANIDEDTNLIPG